MLLCHQKTLMNPQSFQTTLNEERGEGKPFCDLVGVSIQGNWEIRALIAFVSTSFVQDWRWTFIAEGWGACGSRLGWTLHGCVVSLDKTVYSTLTLSTQVYKLVPAKTILGVALRWRCGTLLLGLLLYSYLFKVVFLKFPSYFIASRFHSIHKCCHSSLAHNLLNLSFFFFYNFKESL